MNPKDFLLMGALLVPLVAGEAQAQRFQWMNKDHKNSTNQNRNDIQWIIMGHVHGAISGYYNNGFPGNPTVTQTTITTAQGPRDATVLKWPVRATPITNGETVHVGILVDMNNWPPPNPNQLIGFSHATWTLNGTPMEIVSGCAGVGTIVSPGSTDVTIIAPIDAPPITVDQFSYALRSTPAPLESLTWNSPTIPWQPLHGSFNVQPGQEVNVGTVPGTSLGAYFVVQASVAFLGQSPGDAGHVINQRQLLASVPGASGNAMLVLALLLFALGLWWVFRRRVVAAIALLLLTLAPAVTSASLTVNGDANDRQDFLTRLAQGSGRILAFKADGVTVNDLGPDPNPHPSASATFAGIVQKMIGDASTTNFNVGRSSDANDPECNGVTVDRFSTRTVDLDDLDHWPEQAPAGNAWAPTLYQTLIHFLREYGFAAQNAQQAGETADDYFDRCHTDGIAGENGYRGDRGQGGTVTGAFLKADGVTGAVTLNDGNIENSTINNCDVTAIGYKHTAPLTRARLDAASSGGDLQFEGRVIAVVSAPCCPSGRLMQTLAVLYQVEHVIKGNPGPQVVVEHARVDPEPGCAPPALFQPGAQFQVTASLVPGPEGPFYLGDAAPPVPASSPALLVGLALLLATAPLFVRGARRAER